QPPGRSRGSGWRRSRSGRARGRRRWVASRRTCGLPRVCAGRGGDTTGGQRRAEGRAHGDVVRAVAVALPQVRVRRRPDPARWVPHLPGVRDGDRRGPLRARSGPVAAPGAGRGVHHLGDGVPDAGADDAGAVAGRVVRAGRRRSSVRRVVVGGAVARRGRGVEAGDRPGAGRPGHRGGGGVGRVRRGVDTRPVVKATLRPGGSGRIGDATAAQRHRRGLVALTRSARKMPTAAQMSVNAISRSRSNGSPKRTTAVRNCIVGLRYCRNPMVVSGSLWAAATNQSSGSAVTTPESASSTSVGSVLAASASGEACAHARYGTAAGASSSVSISSPGTGPIGSCLRIRL